MQQITRGLLAAGVAALLSACGGGNPAPQEKTPTHTPAAVTTSTAAPKTWAATFTGTLQVLSEPHGRPLQALPQKNRYGARTTLLVRRLAGDWVQLYLPTWPNASTGWALRKQLQLQERTWMILIDRAHRKITITRDGQKIAAGPVAIGRPGAATPAGQFFVTEALRPPNPNGAYGSIALGLSAHSPNASIRAQFAGGGQIGIHETNQPDSIGKPVSHGCVRVPDSVGTVLKKIPAGTPVRIT